MAPPILHPANGRGERLALAEGFFQWLYGDDRRGGGQQRCESFREPVVKSAQRALTAIIAILIVLLAGIAFLVRAYHIGATDPGTAGYQSVLSQLTAAVAGQGVFTTSRWARSCSCWRSPQTPPLRTFRDSAARSPRTDTFPRASPREEDGWCTRKESGCSRCCVPRCLSYFAGSRTG